ncbi:MAG: type II toxin-antitoxin system Phd/YefM family antitoxin [Cyanobacteria bacterium]|nr:type II toxin-antitoxin system Phd/YefM family antitoxin [Cyanobacteriota bacterium]MDA1247513.1 type II toxin-antitoxin system Phd/YefM family antitoxin [Cyanobacteriota bacterium]
MTYPPFATEPTPSNGPQQVNVHEAKTQLSRLLLLVEQGEEIWIARAGKPIARLSAWVPTPSAAQSPGAMRHAIAIAANFDAPLQ